MGVGFLPEVEALLGHQPSRKSPLSQFLLKPWVLCGSYFILSQLP
jgi:hypothetical protein